MNTLEFILEGLDWVNCASRIEEKVKNLDIVNDASLNFISKTLHIKYEDHNKLEEITTKVRDIVKFFEPHVEVLDKKEFSSDLHSQKDHLHTHSSKDMKFVVIGIILFAIAIVLKNTYYIRFILFLTSYILIGGEVLLRAYRNISKGQIFDENFLMTIATIGAFLIGEFPEGVAVMLFYQIGEYFQDMAVNRSRKSITELMDIRPDYANLLGATGEIKVSPKDVRIGSVIIVKPGEKVPLDGVILEGSSSVDTSALTGESLPRDVQEGSKILSGFINKQGLLKITVEKEYGESTVSKILELVESAGSKKSPTENFITKFARYYTPFVVFVALLIAVIPPLLIDGADFSSWFYRALVFLVVSCPCALVISIPLGFFGGIGGASKAGILIKGGNYLEALNSVETIVFDKTGTLTKGKFSVVDILTKGNLTKDELLELAANVESYSSHPIAHSIIKSYSGILQKHKVLEYKELAGLGVHANYDGDNVLLGNDDLFNENNIEIMTINKVGTKINIAINNIYEGSIIVADEIKEDAKIGIKELKALGIKDTIMLTGDNEKVAKEIGESLGIDRVFSNLLPHEKVTILEDIQDKVRKGKKLVYIGDGINDAPVLARADIGIAMGGLGSDAAIEAADIVLMTDEIRKIPTALKIAKKTKEIVWQNIIFALGVKAVVLILGASGNASMWEAVFADVGVALIAVLNASRILNYKADWFKNTAQEIPRLYSFYLLDILYKTFFSSITSSRETPEARNIFSGISTAISFIAKPLFVRVIFTTLSSLTSLDLCIKSMDSNFFKSGVRVPVSRSKREPISLIDKGAFSQSTSMVMYWV